MGFDTSFDRKSGIGASESFAAKEECIELYQSKLGLIEEFTGNEATELGQETEPINLKIGCRKAGIKLKSINEDTRRHPQHPGIFATADAFGTAEINGREEEVIIEAKMVGVNRAVHWGNPDDGWDAIPEYVRTQVIQQMAVYDVWYAYVSCLMGTQVKVYGPLIRDLGKEREQINKTLAFLEKIKNKEEPPINEKPAWKKYLSKKFQQARRMTRKGNAQINRKILRRLELSEMLSDLQKERDAIDNRLRAEIGDMEAVETTHGIATWRKNRLGNRILKVKRKKE